MATPQQVRNHFKDDLITWRVPSSDGIVQLSKPKRGQVTASPGNEAIIPTFKLWNIPVNI
ncbi:hypothetical protein BM221_004898 [Beauveria bassiana]|uniref:Uncharacterized protein n=1 Tax=Beauveria bassiana TaxID=176275 RepID=A0A2N6N7T7_BEABA|nr:hypothetical protein BM221_010848 [Beauveria bassiana]PMB68324.1 hypothetical protein BM221_004898 [Beauveria bassiana]